MSVIVKKWMGIVTIKIKCSDEPRQCISTAHDGLTALVQSAQDFHGCLEQTSQFRHGDGRQLSGVRGDSFDQKDSQDREGGVESCAVVSTSQTQHGKPVYAYYNNKKTTKPPEDSDHF